MSLIEAIFPPYKLHYSFLQTIESIALDLLLCGIVRIAGTKRRPGRNTFLHVVLFLFFPQCDWPQLTSARVVSASYSNSLSNGNISSVSWVRTWRALSTVFVVFLVAAAVSVQINDVERNVFLAYDENSPCHCRYSSWTFFLVCITIGELTRCCCLLSIIAPQMVRSQESSSYNLIVLSYSVVLLCINLVAV